MIIPPYLLPGDRIRIVSPAGKVQKDKILPKNLALMLGSNYQLEVAENSRLRRQIL